MASRNLQLQQRDAFFDGLGNQNARSKKQLTALSWQKCALSNLYKQIFRT
jgi:hypothetical protein